MMIGLAISPVCGLRTSGGGSPAPSGPVLASAPTMVLASGSTLNIGGIFDVGVAVWDDPQPDTVTHMVQRNSAGGWMDVEAAGSTYTITADDAANIGATQYALRIQAIGSYTAVGETISNSATITPNRKAAPTITGTGYVIEFTGDGDGHIGDEMQIVSAGFSAAYGNPTAGASGSWNTATGGNVITTAEASAYTIAIRYGLSLTNSSGSASTSSNALFALPLAAPFATVDPQIGKPGDDLELTSEGGWAGNEAPTFSGRQWQMEVLDGWEDVSGETGTVLGSAVIGVNYRCVVTYDNSGGATAVPSNSLFY